MDKLYELLISRFDRELTYLEIGYSFNQSNLDFLNDLVNCIDYLSNVELTQQEILQIIKYYDK